MTCFGLRIVPYKNLDLTRERTRVFHILECLRPDYASQDKSDSHSLKTTTTYSSFEEGDVTENYQTIDRLSSIENFFDGSWCQIQDCLMTSFFSSVTLHARKQS